MKILRLFTLAFALTFVSSALNAATIDFRVTSQTGNFITDGIFFPPTSDTNTDSVSTLGSSSSASRSTSSAQPPNSFSPNGESTTSSASADASTGELKSKTVNTNSFSASGFAVIDLILFGSVDVVGGSGSVTMLLDYDGSWNLSPGSWQAQAQLTYLGRQLPDESQFNQGLEPNTGSASGTLSVTKFFSEGQDQALTIKSTIFTQILSGTSGFVDLSAILSIVTSQGTTVTFDDPRTLSVDPSAVPLPAALPLLGGALSLLGFFGWRRKRLAAT